MSQDMNSAGDMTAARPENPKIPFLTKNSKVKVLTPEGRVAYRGRVLAYNPSVGKLGSYYEILTDGEQFEGVMLPPARLVIADED